MGSFLSKNKIKTYLDIDNYLETNHLDKINIIFSIDYSYPNLYRLENKINHQSLILNDIQRIIYMLNQFLNTYIDNTLYCYGFGDAITNNLTCFDYFYQDEIYDFEHLFKRYKHLNNLIDPYIGKSDLTNIIKKSTNIYQQNKNFTLLFTVSYNDTIIDNIKNKVIQELYNNNVFMILIYLGKNKNIIKKIKKHKSPNIKFIIYENIKFKNNIEISFEISKFIIEKYKKYKIWL